MMLVCVKYQEITSANFAAFLSAILQQENLLNWCCKHGALDLV